MKKGRRLFDLFMENYLSPKKGDEEENTDDDSKSNRTLTLRGDDNREAPDEERFLTTRTAPSSSRNQSGPLNICPDENRFTSQKYTFMPTAIVLLSDAYGVPTPFRAILDIGSNANVITEETAQKLGISSRDSNMQISMIGKVFRNIREISTMIRSRNPEHSTFVKDITCLIVPIHSPVPHRNVNYKNFDCLPKCFLADPRFHKAGKVDMIVGSDITLRSFQNDSNNLPNGGFLKETKFGWIVVGSITDKFCGTEILYERAK